MARLAELHSGGCSLMFRQVSEGGAMRRQSIRGFLCGVGLSLCTLSTLAQGAEDVSCELNRQGRLVVRQAGKVVFASTKPPALHAIRWTKGVNPKPQWMRQAKTRMEPARNRYTSRHRWGGFQITASPQPNGIDLLISVANTTPKDIGFCRIWLASAWVVSQNDGKTRPVSKGMIVGGNEPLVATGTYPGGACVVSVKANPEGVLAGFRDQGRITFELSQLPARQTRTHTVQLRFDGDPGDETNVLDLAENVFADYADKKPRTLEWPDRRPIGTFYPASSHLGAGTVGKTTNPRGWIDQTPENPVDITTAVGRKRFRDSMTRMARTVVSQCKRLDAQGVIVWCIEGQQYPHATSYIGAPNKLPELAPEMDAIADDLFSIWREAGLRTGVCIRPQELTRRQNYDPASAPNEAPFEYYQRSLLTPEGKLDNEAILACLDRKISYAHQRWGCTLFYVDSNVAILDKHWTIYSADIFAELARRFPDCLIIPEHEHFDYWRTTAPVGITPRKVQQTWPKAFSVNLLHNIDLHKENLRHAAATWIGQGDILLFSAWYGDPNSPILRELYRDSTFSLP